ncbi:MAG: adenylyltransferase/cytidyltransferase family protein [Candidatus Pacearchaeota archaeon]
MANNEIIVAASGYFDPLHVGHVEYLKKAKELGTKLIVIVNNTEQAILKKGFEFMPLIERAEIIKALSFVDEVFISIDKDRSVSKSLEKIKPHIFAKGGDRSVGEIPETAICKELGIKIIDGLGEKIQSSSSLVKNAGNRKQPSAQAKSL